MRWREGLRLDQDGKATALAVCETPRRVLVRAGLSLWLIDRASCRRLAKHSFARNPTFREVLLPESILCNALFWRDDRIVAVLSPMAYLVSARPKEPVIEILSAKDLSVISRFGGVDRRCGMAVMGDHLYIGSSVIDLEAGQVVGAGPPHRELYRELLGWQCNTDRGVMYIGGARQRPNEERTTRVLAKLPLGTPRLEWLYEEPNPETDGPDSERVGGADPRASGGTP